MSEDRDSSALSRWVPLAIPMAFALMAFGALQLQVKTHTAEITAVKTKVDTHVAIEGHAVMVERVNRLERQTENKLDKLIKSVDRIDRAVTRLCAAKNVACGP